MNKIIDELKEWGCDVEVALDRFIQDEELYISCLEKFVEDESFGKLDDSLAAKDYEDAFNQSHTLKGVAANLGLDPMFQAISNIVEDLRANKYDDLESKLQAVHEAHDRFRDIMA